MSLRAATGTSDFVKLRKLNAYYVDKTAFVDQWLASLDEAVLLPRPRRCGKTLNMSTLRTCVERSPIDRRCSTGSRCGTRTTHASTFSGIRSFI